MRVTLLHNPKAGDESHGRAWLEGLLAGIGWQADYHSTKEEGWEAALDAAASAAAAGGGTEAVVVAGGDGTVRKAALRLAGSGVPLAMLPMGTANNLATALQGAPGEAEAVVTGWRRPRRRSLDVWRVEGPGGAVRAIESVGLGLLARVMGHRVADELESVDEARGFVRRWLEGQRAVPWRLEADGRALEGRWLLAEAMNIPCIGPNLCLAHGADGADGRLDLVLLEESARHRLVAMLAPAGAAASNGSTPAFHALRVSELRATCDLADLHVDDEPHPAELGRGSSATGEVSIVVTRDPAGSVEFLLPRPGLAGPV